MIWFLTKRQVIYELHKFRWRDDGFWLGNMAKYQNGVLRKDFEAVVFANEFSSNWLTYPLKWLHEKLRPRYLETFNPKLKEVIDECIEEKYIKTVSSSEGERLSLRCRGKDLIRLRYFPQLFFGNAYVKAVIISALTLITSYYITENITSKISNAIIQTHESRQK